MQALMMCSSGRTCLRHLLSLGMSWKMWRVKHHPMWEVNHLHLPLTVRLLRRRQTHSVYNNSLFTVSLSSTCQICSSSCWRLLVRRFGSGADSKDPQLRIDGLRNFVSLPSECAAVCVVTCNDELADHNRLEWWKLNKSSTRTVSLQ